MKKTILLLAIILLAGQVFAQIPEDLDARVAKLVELTLDKTDNKLRGFDRVDLNTYEMQIKGNHYYGDITIDFISNNKYFLIIDRRVFDDRNIARRYKGSYLIALEKFGFKYGYTSEHNGSLIYYFNKYSVFVSDNNNEIKIVYSYIGE